jgi:hypothetical protein
MNLKIGDVVGPAPLSAMPGYVYNKFLNEQFIMCRAERRNKTMVLVVCAIDRTKDAKSDN